MGAGLATDSEARQLAAVERSREASGLTRAGYADALRRSLLILTRDGAPVSGKVASVCMTEMPGVFADGAPALVVVAWGSAADEVMQELLGEMAVDAVVVDGHETGTVH